MGLSLGKIVKSNGHTDYVCQVYGRHEFDPVPEPENYALGTFVSIELSGADSGYLIGLIYDTVLLNPEFGRLGPRLSTEAELVRFTPDYLEERATLIGITAIGRLDASGAIMQGVPRLAANSDALVAQLDSDAVRHFHTASGGVDLSYLPLLLRRDNPLAYHLARIVLDRLMALLPDHQTELDVLADDLGWLSQIGPMGGGQ